MPQNRTSPDQLPAPEPGLSIVGLEGNPDDAVLQLPSAPVAAAVSSVRGRSVRLVRSIVAESHRHLSALTGQEIPLSQKLLTWTRIDALRPTLQLAGTDLLSAATTPIGSLFGLFSLLETIFLAEGRVVCGKPKCGSKRFDLHALATTAVDHARIHADSVRGIIIGIPEPFSLPRNEAECGELLELEFNRILAAEAPRVFVGSTYFRIDDEAGRGKFLATLQALPAGPVEIFLVLHALSVERATAGTILGLLKEEHRRHPNLELRIQHSDRTLGTRWPSRLGFHCEKCGLSFPPLTAEAANSAPIECRGLTREQCTKLPLSELLEHFPELHDRAAPLAATELDLPLARTPKDLSSSERLLLAWALADSAEYSDLLLAGERIAARLDPARFAIFFSIANRIISRGARILLAEEELEEPFSSDQQGAGRQAIETTEPATRSAKPAAKSSRSKSIPIPGGLLFLYGPNGSGKTRLMDEARAATLANVPGKRRSATSWTTIDGEILAAAEAASSLTQRRRPPLLLGELLGLSAPLAAVLAALPSARRAGLTEKELRLDNRESRCPSCLGFGKMPQRDLAPAEWLLCERCLGARFNENVLDAEFAGKNLTELLALNLLPARQLFHHHESLSNRLETLAALGGSKLLLGTPAALLDPEDLIRVHLAAALNDRTPSSSIIALDHAFDLFSRDDRERIAEVMLEFARLGGAAIITTLTAPPSLRGAEIRFLNGAASLGTLSTQQILDKNCKYLFF